MDEEFIQKAKTVRDYIMDGIVECKSDEDRSKMYADLDKVSQLILKYEVENEKLREAKIAEINDRDLALTREKNENRRTIVSTAGQLLTLIGSFVGYGLLLDKQNRFEITDNYTLSGSKSVIGGIGKLPRIR